MERLISLLGILALLGIAFLMSNNKRKINFRTVLVGTGIQFSLGVVLMHLVIHATDSGLSPVAAAGLIAVIGVAGIIGRLTLGRLADV
ncbi:hypothetical protein KKA08_02205, partial [bacterium]|nr:hypothetical protein [bacterium]